MNAWNKGIRHGSCLLEIYDKVKKEECVLKNIMTNIGNIYWGQMSTIKRDTRVGKVNSKGILKPGTWSFYKSQKRKELLYSPDSFTHS